jgi:uncharacterized cupin superfamily protein
MAENRPASVRAMDVPARHATVYPPEYAPAVAGRSKRALGDYFGLTQYGLNLTVLEPGASSALRHWHEIEDEFVYVLEGEILLIDNDGEHLLTPGMCAGFKAGVPNGHKLVNRSGSTASYLEVGLRSPTERAHYPDVDLAGIKENGKFRFTRKDGSAL